MLPRCFIFVIFIDIAVKIMYYIIGFLFVFTDMEEKYYVIT